MVRPRLFAKAMTSVGSSLGGMLSLQLAALEPSRVVGRLHRGPGYGQT